MSAVLAELARRLRDICGDALAAWLWRRTR